MLRLVTAFTLVALATMTVPAAVADGPIICWGQISLDCGIPNDPCDVLGGGSPKDLCGIGWFGCQADWRYCIVDPIKDCGYGGSSCILP